MSDRFYNELKRRNYTTPTSYLELISLYIHLFRIQQDIVPQSIKKYRTGLQRLKETNEQVGTLQDELVVLQPKIEQSVIECGEQMEVLSVKQNEAAIEEAAVAEETAQCE